MLSINVVSSVPNFQTDGRKRTLMSSVCTGKLLKHIIDFQIDLPAVNNGKKQPTPALLAVNSFCRQICEIHSELFAISKTHLKQC